MTATRLPMKRKAKTPWARAASSLPSGRMEKRLMCWLRISMCGEKELSSAFFSSISFETTNEATDAGNETSFSWSLFNRRAASMLAASRSSEVTGSQLLSPKSIVSALARRASRRKAMSLAFRRATRTIQPMGGTAEQLQGFGHGLARFLQFETFRWLLAIRRTSSTVRLRLWQKAVTRWT